MNEAPRGPRRPSPSGLDPAIDAALREMVGGEGPADLRRRVLARLGERPSHLALSPWPALAAAGLILAAAVSLLLVRQASPPERAASAVHERSARRPAMPPVAAPAMVARAARVPSLPAAPRAHRTVRAEASQPALEAEDGVDVTPIDVSPLAVAPMGDARVALTPLRIEHMDIEPLAEPQP